MFCQSMQSVLRNPIMNTQPPHNVSKVRSFLILVNFCARYIPNLASVSEPLRNLTRKHNKFVWGQKEQGSFEKLKQCFDNTETADYYDKTAQTIVICNVNPVGLGAVLLKKQGDHYRAMFW